MKDIGMSISDHIHELKIRAARWLMIAAERVMRRASSALKALATSRSQEAIRHLESKRGLL